MDEARPGSRPAGGWAVQIRSRRICRTLGVLASFSPSQTNKAILVDGLISLAGGEGFEPPLTESESVVLPLDDPPVVQLCRRGYQGRDDEIRT